MASSLTKHGTIITAGDLYDHGKQSGFSWIDRNHHRDEKMMRGCNEYIMLSDGLSVHFSDTQELQDLEVESDSQAHFGVKLFLEGNIDATIGKLQIPMPTISKDGTKVRPIASVFSQTKPEKFRRRLKKGERIRKVIATARHSWILDRDLGNEQEAKQILSFTKTHLACRSWTPSPSAIAAAEQILNPPELPTSVYKLYIEIRVLTLLAEAFMQITKKGKSNHSDGLRPQDRARLERIEQFLEATPNTPITTDMLAHHIGTSVNTLQRLYQNVHGTSVSDFVRRWRLQKARAGLEFNGLSIGEASFIAGYTSPANFATAFKREFGISPKDAKTQL
ncbi:MAG: AraC family transcriptional regulator [Cohaesibacter sp.]|nr:AraC family transcriptional regulator [Cohaesibacter sp.]